MKIGNINPNTNAVDIFKFNIDLTITVGDILNIILLLLTVMGLIFTLLQLRQTEKINRATLVKELYWTLYNDAELREIFYKIEWSNYSKSEFTFCQTDDERKVDKLLSFFEVICSMYYRKILTDSDMNLFNYEMKRVYSHPAVKEYFAFLERWQDSQQTERSFVHFKRFCRIL